MEGESKIESSSSTTLLLEIADCDRLERHLSELDQRYQRSFVEQLFLELCSRFQLTYEYENCFQYLLL